MKQHLAQMTTHPLVVLGQHSLLISSPPLICWLLRFPLSPNNAGPPVLLPSHLCLWMPSGLALIRARALGRCSADVSSLHTPPALNCKRVGPILHDISTGTQIGSFNLTGSEKNLISDWPILHTAVYTHTHTYSSSGLPHFHK